jgi:predicted RNA-binding Zn-ribbon protein involved in translation (DUF1610 family)
MTSPIKIDPQVNGQQIVYEFGARLDPASEPDVTMQIMKARQLYNQIISVMRDIHGEMQTFVMEHAGPEAQALQARIEALGQQFMAAKARNDEPEMIQIAQERREARKVIYPLLSETRKTLRTDLIERFYSRIGNHSRCDTYHLRSEAVKDGLGFGTASQVLDRALEAWKDSMKKGNAPRFSMGSEKIQDTLTIQFTQAGGAVAEDIVLAKRKDVIIEFPKNGFRKRSYTPFQFRLGAATDHCYAEGTLQMDRPFPEGAHVALARLVRLRIGMKYQYKIQFLLTLQEPVKIESPTRKKPLVALHFGWSFDARGRRLAGVSDNGDVLDASLLHLPPEIENNIKRSAVILSERDNQRDAIIPTVKEIVLPDLPEEDPLAVLFGKIQKTPAQHVSANRLHYLFRLLREKNIAIPEALEAWRKKDRMQWQTQASLARTARNRRKTLYRQVALDWAQTYQTILIEMPDLKKAALKLDEKTGEKTELAKKSRAGRTLAALYELESAIRWAACKCGSAILKLQGEHTASTCSLCGGITLQTDEEDSQVQYCPNCGSTVDRKKNGAANGWKAAHADLESLVTEYWQTVLEQRTKAAERKAEKSAKMAEGRKTSQAARKAITP